jgi:hypothetical protein
MRPSLLVAILWLVRWRFDDLKLGLISFFVFVAWVIAATGWVRALAVVWLIYPAMFIRRTIRGGTD